MLMRNFASYLRGSATSIRRSGYDLIGYNLALKYMLVLICMALLFSSNSHSENNDLVSWIIIMYEKQSN